MYPTQGIDTFSWSSATGRLFFFFFFFFLFFFFFFLKYTDPMPLINIAKVQLAKEENITDIPKQFVHFNRHEAIFQIVAYTIFAD